MGDPRKFRKSYSRPFKLWDEERIEEERGLLQHYGLKNKEEIWKSAAMLRRFQAQAKKLIATKGRQADNERKQLMEKLASLGLVSQDSNLDTVLGLTLKDLLERRLQTVVYNKKLAKTISQARQFITHEHIAVGEKKISVPSYMVKKLEESSIAFAPDSGLTSEMHPERVQQKKEAGEAEEGAKEKTTG